MSEMVERVARVICRELASRGEPDCIMDDHPERPKCTAKICSRFQIARAAIAAMREPTRDMVHAAQSWITDERGVWQDMVDAALEPVDDEKP